MDTRYGAFRYGTQRQHIGRDHWRSRLDDVTTLGVDELSARRGRHSTSRAIAELERDLTVLRGRRRDIEAEISSERCGFDRTRNEGLFRALNRRASTEARIAAVCGRIAELSAQPPDSVVRASLRRHIVVPGGVVEVYHGADRTESERLVLTAIRPVEPDECSTRSPLGRAILGRRAGQTVRYACPDGRMRAATVVRLA